MKILRRVVKTACLLMMAMLVTSCASKEAMNMKIHTEPEGSHIVYRVALEDMEHDPPWVYLGVTPYQGLTLMDSDAFTDDATITFKVMRHGYMDQVKEWSGEQFLREYENENRLFWTPRLVKAGT